MRRVLDRFDVRGIPTLLVDIDGNLQLVSVPPSWEPTNVTSWIEDLSPEALAWLFPRPGSEHNDHKKDRRLRPLRIPLEDLENRRTLIDSAVCRLRKRDEAHRAPVPASSSEPEGDMGGAWQSPARHGVRRRRRSNVLALLDTLASRAQRAQ